MLEYNEKLAFEKEKQKKTVLQKAMTMEKGKPPQPLEFLPKLK